MPTILVIDDSAAHRDQIRGALREIPGPMLILEAEDGFQGLKVLMREPVDLVVCDLEMPRLDGEKLLRMRDGSPGGGHTPFLFLSSSTDLERRTRLLRSGASDAMTKPFHPPELVARVMLHLKIKRLQDELLLKNAALERLSTVDALTGLRARRFVDEALHVEFQRARRYGTPFAVVLMDLDHFKQVNDEHGHVAGDTVLRGVGERVRSLMRGTDVAARYGGEEVVLVLPQNTVGGATVLAERIRETVAAVCFESPVGVAFSVTASLGTAQYDPADERPEDIVQRADQALYAAKAAGRNRVHTA